MINAVVDYIVGNLDLATNYGLCEIVQVNEDQSHVKQLGENGEVIDFDKTPSCSYILPTGSVEGEELEGNVGGEILQRLNYPIELVVFKKRCELPEIDEIYKVIQSIATNNDYELVRSSKAFSGAKIIFNSAIQNKLEIWQRDFIGKDFRIGLDKILISLNLTIQLDLDLKCDNIKSC